MILSSELQAECKYFFASVRERFSYGMWSEKSEGDACKKNALLHTSSYTLVMQFAGVGISFEKRARLLGFF